MWCEGSGDVAGVLKHDNSGSLRDPPGVVGGHRYYTQIRLIKWGIDGYSAALVVAVTVLMHAVPFCHTAR